MTCFQVNALEGGGESLALLKPVPSRSFHPSSLGLLSAVLAFRLQTFARLFVFTKEARTGAKNMSALSALLLVD